MSSLISVEDDMVGRLSFTDAFLFCEYKHIGAEVKNKVCNCIETHSIFDKEIK